MLGQPIETLIPDRFAERHERQRTEFFLDPRQRPMGAGLELFGKRITVAEDQTHQYVTAIIKVRAKRVIVVTLNGEIIHDGDYKLSRVLR